jgi:hypothetical protein
VEEVNEEILDRLEKSIDDLRNQFEQYFLGSRKKAPEQELTTVTYTIRRLSNQTITQTRMRFRFQQLTSKFNSYNQYWNRTLQQIEAGTYFRDRFKQKIKAIDAAEPVAPPPKAQKPEKKSGVPDDHIDAVYQDFIAARQQCNQPGSISRDKLAETIQKQADALKDKYKGKDIRFKVVVENGQAKLKATIK